MMVALEWEDIMKLYEGLWPESRGMSPLRGAQIARLFRHYDAEMVKRAMHSYLRQHPDSPKPANLWGYCLEVAAKTEAATHDAMEKADRRNVVKALRDSPNEYTRTWAASIPDDEYLYQKWAESLPGFDLTEESEGFKLTEAQRQRYGVAAQRRQSAETTPSPPSPSSSSCWSTTERNGRGSFQWDPEAWPTSERPAW